MFVQLQILGNLRFKSAMEDLSAQRAAELVEWSVQVFEVSEEQAEEIEAAVSVKFKR